MTAVVAADAALVLSELVTHSGDERPDLLPVEPNRIGGLGLHVVGRVAGDWGVAPFPGGKTVWATLLQPDR